MNIKIIAFCALLFSFPGCRNKDFIEKEKELYVINLNGARFEESSEKINFLPFGTRVIFEKELLSNNYLVRSDKYKNISISSNDVKEDLPKKLYIKNIFGMDIDKNTHIPFSEEVELLSIENRDSLILKISYHGNVYAVNEIINLSTKPQKMMYLVTARKGLNLRKGPGIKFPIITTLPMETKGIILKVENKLETIQLRTGYWFYTKVNDFEGWLFSGYVITGENPIMDEMDEIKYEKIQNEIEDNNFFLTYKENNESSEISGRFIEEKYFEKIKIIKMEYYPIRPLQVKFISNWQEFISFLVPASPGRV